MDEHTTGADARIDRRQFLELGAGLAGALSLGALLAACGAPAA
jgi:hypothetical protein